MDKRTKEYKDWKAKHDSAPKGLGDTIDNITTKTGVKDVVKAIFGDDCGCDERRKKLNNTFSYKPVECFTENQYNDWTDFKNRKNKDIVTPEQQKLIKDLLLHLYKISIQDNCPSCSGSSYVKWIGMIDKIYDTYQ